MPLEPLHHTVTFHADDFKSFPVMDDKTTKYYVIAMYDNDHGIVYYCNHLDNDNNEVGAIDAFHPSIDIASKWDVNHQSKRAKKVAMDVYNNIETVKGTKGADALHITLMSVLDVRQIRRVSEVVARDLDEGDLDYGDLDNGE